MTMPKQRVANIDDVENSEKSEFIHEILQKNLINVS